MDLANKADKGTISSEIVEVWWIVFIKIFSQDFVEVQLSLINESMLSKTYTSTDIEFCFYHYCS